MTENEQRANRKMSRIRNRFRQVLQTEGKGNRFCLSLAVQRTPIGSSQTANRWTALASCALQSSLIDSDADHHFHDKTSKKKKKKENKKGRRVLGWLCPGRLSHNGFTVMDGRCNSLNILLWKISTLLMHSSQREPSLIERFPPWPIK